MRRSLLYACWAVTFLVASVLGCQRVSMPDASPINADATGMANASAPSINSTAPMTASVSASAPEAQVLSSSISSVSSASPIATAPALETHTDALVGAAATLVAPVVAVAAQADAATTTTGVDGRKEPHPRAAQYKRGLIQESHYVWGLNAPVASFAAQIHQESRWNPSARSPVGAAGLTQFMPATAKWISGMDGQLASGDVYNPRWAMRALVVYDKFLFQKVSAANDCERLAFAMSAYNGGLGWVIKRKARSARPNVCFGATCDINPGVSAASQRENAGYPQVILKGFEAQYVRAGWGRGACHE